VNLFTLVCVTERGAFEAREQQIERFELAEGIRADAGSPTSCFGSEAQRMRSDPVGW